MKLIRREVGATLLAHKVLSLCDDLTGTERRVAAAIIDHYNRRTGQCDPGITTLAELLGINRRTVIRATQALVLKGYLRKCRHGGNFHRNSYEPEWRRFRGGENAWADRRRRLSRKHIAPEMSPCPGQPGHLDGDRADTQTCSRNTFEETLIDASSERRSRALNDPKGSKGSGRVSMTAESYSVADQRFHVKSDQAFGSSVSTKKSSFTQAVKSGDAGRAAAERRWNQDLYRLIGKNAALSGMVAEAFQPAWQDDATEAEFRRPGSGINLIVRTLNANGIAIDLPGQRKEGEGDGA